LSVNALTHPLFRVVGVEGEIAHFKRRWEIVNDAV
jgi:hypothetical protein